MVPLHFCLFFLWWWELTHSLDDSIQYVSTCAPIKLSITDYLLSGLEQYCKYLAADLLSTKAKNWKQVKYFVIFLV